MGLGAWGDPGAARASAGAGRDRGWNWMGEKPCRDAIPSFTQGLLEVILMASPLLLSSPAA